VSSGSEGTMLDQASGFARQNQTFDDELWSEEEHACFVQALQEQSGGINWHVTAQRIGTKSAQQVEKHCNLYITALRQKQNLAQQLGHQREMSTTLSLGELYSSFGLPAPANRSASMPSTSLPLGGQFQPQQPSFLSNLQSNQLSSLAALLQQQIQQPPQQALPLPQQLTGLEAQARKLEEAITAQAQQQRLFQNMRPSRTISNGCNSRFHLSSSSSSNNNNNNNNNNNCNSSNSSNSSVTVQLPCSPVAAPWARVQAARTCCGNFNSSSSSSKCVNFRI